MPANKATPKAEITLLSKGDEGWKFAHSPSGLADFSVKQKLGKKFTFGVGFTVGADASRKHSEAASEDRSLLLQHLQLQLNLQIMITSPSFRLFATPAKS
jgi:hypothetical protein